MWLVNPKHGVRKLFQGESARVGAAEGPPEDLSGLCPHCAGWWTPSAPKAALSHCGGLVFVLNQIYLTDAFLQLLVTRARLEATHAAAESISPSPPSQGTLPWGAGLGQGTGGAVLDSSACTGTGTARSSRNGHVWFPGIIVAHHSPVIAKLSERITTFIPHDRSKFPPKLLTSAPWWEDQLLQCLWDS